MATPVNNYGQVAYWAEYFGTFEFSRLSEKRYLLYFQNKTDREEFISSCSDRFSGHKMRDDFNLLIFF